MNMRSLVLIGCAVATGLLLAAGTNREHLWVTLNPLWIGEGDRPFDILETDGRVVGEDGGRCSCEVSNLGLAGSLSSVSTSNETSSVRIEWFLPLGISFNTPTAKGLWTPFYDSIDAGDAHSWGLLLRLLSDYTEQKNGDYDLKLLLGMLYDDQKIASKEGYRTVRHYLTWAGYHSKRVLSHDGRCQERTYTGLLDMAGDDRFHGEAFFLLAGGLIGGGHEDGKLTKFQLAPLFKWDSQGTFLTLLGGRDINGKSTNTYVTPLLKISSVDSDSSFLAPFWWQRGRLHDKDGDLDATILPSSYKLKQAETVVRREGKSVTNKYWKVNGSARSSARDTAERKLGFLPTNYLSASIPDLAVVGYHSSFGVWPGKEDIQLTCHEWLSPLAYGDDLSAWECHRYVAFDPVTRARKGELRSSSYGIGELLQLTLDETFDAEKKSIGTSWRFQILGSFFRLQHHTHGNWGFEFLFLPIVGRDSRE